MDHGNFVGTGSREPRQLYEVFRVTIRDGGGSVDNHRQILAASRGQDINVTRIIR